MAIGENVAIRPNNNARTLTMSFFGRLLFSLPPEITAKLTGQRIVRNLFFIIERGSGGFLNHVNNDNSRGDPFGDFDEGLVKLARQVEVVTLLFPRAL